MKKKIIIALIAVIIVAEGIFLLKKALIFLPSRTPAVVNIPAGESVGAVKSKKEAPADWATAKSRSGFSVRYPSDKVGAMFGDGDGLLSLFFVFDPKAIGVEGDGLEKLQDDIDGLRMFYRALVITVMKPESSNLSSQAEAIVVGNGKSSDEKVLSHRSTPTTFSGQEAYIITRQMEAPERQGRAHYVQKDIFFLNGEYLYRISRVVPSDDTVFPRSGGSAGKDFLSYVSERSSEILQTFVFDGSLRTSIIVPPNKAPELSGEAKDRRESLLAALRQGPYFDEQKKYEDITSRDRCDAYGKSKENNSQQDLAPSPGIFYSVRGMMAGDKDDLTEIHGYDDQGGHTGPVPLPAFDRSYPEEGAEGIDFMDRFGPVQYLSVDGAIDGKVEIRGKGFSPIMMLEMSGDGNECIMAEVTMPMTPHTVATIPMTARGDVGPISYDIDGDGVEDLKMSLIHPLLPEKQRQLYAVYEDLGGK